MMTLNNVRTDNILSAAAEVSKAQELLQTRTVWFKKAEAEYQKKQGERLDAQNRLEYALKKLEEATR